LIRIQIETTTNEIVDKNKTADFLITVSNVFVFDMVLLCGGFQMSNKGLYFVSRTAVTEIRKEQNIFKQELIENEDLCYVSLRRPDIPAVIIEYIKHLLLKKVLRRNALFSLFFLF
jgi:hypothetical protein